MKIIAIEKEIPGLTASDFQPYLDAEASRVWELQQAGVIREMYFRTDRREAVLILECTNKEEAEGHLGTLPLVKENLISFEIIGLKPYDGIQRLFREIA